MATKSNKAKETKDMYRYKLLIKNLDRLERSLRAEVDIHWCSNTISWLWKWKKITKEEADILCERVIDLCSYYGL